MTDPLKTFLERARDGGWEDADSILNYSGRAAEDQIEIILFNPKAAEAVWGAKKIDCECECSIEEAQWHPTWMIVQRRFLDHIQNGDTPLEALEKEL